MGRREIQLPLVDDDLIVTGAFLRETGLLWKINHDILHPLGLALGVGVNIDDDGTITDLNRPAILSLHIADDGVWEYPAEANAEKMAQWAEFAGPFAAFSPKPPRQAFVDVVFDGPPAHESGRFVECERPDGSSCSVGQWIDRGNGLWALRIPLGGEQ